MRFATWNVNSIRTRVDRVIAFLQRSDTDVLAMQEIKCRPDQFPIEPFEEAGYHVAIHGLNQWNRAFWQRWNPGLVRRDSHVGPRSHGWQRERSSRCSQ